MAAVRDGVCLTAVVSGEDLRMSTRDPSGQIIRHDEGVQQVSTGRSALESVFGQGLVDRVLAAVAHPESVQHVTPALGAQVGAAHLLFVRFLQIIKALSRLSTVGGAGRRTEGPRVRTDGASRRADGPLQVARREPAGDDLERRGGGERQAGHQEQRQARRGPGHSVGQGSVAARSATGAGSIAAGGGCAPPRGSDCTPRGPCAGAR